MDIYNLNDIEIELRTTADAACINGLSMLLKNNNISLHEFSQNNAKYRNDYIKYCHDGFKLAQNMILKNVIRFQEESDIVINNLKLAKNKKIKTEIGDLRKKLKHLENIIVLFKHCADALLWQLINGQLWISRRLYLEVNGQKKLKATNYESVKRVADLINSNPMNFVLITDLTNNVQIGDLIGIVDNNFTVIEVKNGIINKKVLETINDLYNCNNSSRREIENLSFDPKFDEHLNRTIKQVKTLQELHQLLATDQGVDSKSGKPIKIYTPKETTHTYTENLILLEEQLSKQKTWAYDVIDECLHIGMYAGNNRFEGYLILKKIGELTKRSCIIVDILEVTNSLNKPIFFLPFSTNTIFDIIFNRTKLYLMLDLDGYIDLLKSFGYDARWGSEKETSKVLNTEKNNPIIKLNNRGIKIILNGSDKSDIWLCYGSLLRIFFEYISPSYMAYSTHYYLTE